MARTLKTHVILRKRSRNLPGPENKTVNIMHGLIYTSRGDDLERAGAGCTKEIMRVFPSSQTHERHTLTANSVFTLKL